MSRHFSWRRCVEVEEGTENFFATRKRDRVHSSAHYQFDTIWLESDTNPETGTVGSTIWSVHDCQPFIEEDCNMMKPRCSCFCSQAHVLWELEIDAFKSENIERSRLVCEFWPRTEQHLMFPRSEFMRLLETFRWKEYTWSFYIWIIWTITNYSILELDFLNIWFVSGLNVLNHE